MSGQNSYDYEAKFQKAREQIESVFTQSYALLASLASTDDDARQQADKLRKLLDGDAE